MKYSFYPGCTLQASAEEYASSSIALLKALGITMEEVDDWVCCGATPAHAVNHLLSVALPAISCAASEKQEADILTCCSACYNRLKQANHELKSDPDLLAKVNEVIEEDYKGSVNVRHVTEVLLNDIGLDEIKSRVIKPLKDLKIACYYGCLIARMPEELRIDQMEYPTLMDDLLKGVGAETIDWPFKTECCGAGLTLSNPKTIARLCGDIMQSAVERGADVIAVICPLCQANLDIYQPEAEEQAGKRFGLPVLYLTQLMGIALDVDPEELGLDKLIVDPRPILAEKGLISTKVCL